jgi:hypothetical protein
MAHQNKIFLELTNGDKLTLTTTIKYNREKKE